MRSLLGSGAPRNAELVRILTILLDNGLEQELGLPHADRLDGDSGNGSEQLCDFLGIGDFCVVVGVGVDQSEHKNAPPKCQ